MAILTGSIGVAVSVQAAGHDSIGSPLAYTATGLPTGLSINGSTGLISGTPTENGLWQTSIGVSSTTGANTYLDTFGWQIGPEASETDEISIGVPAMTDDVGVPLEPFQLQAEGGVAPLQYSLSAGSDSGYINEVPPGISVVSATGVVSGTPTTEGAYCVTATVTDAHGLAASASFIWTIRGSLVTLSVPGIG